MLNENNINDLKKLWELIMKNYMRLNLVTLYVKEPHCMDNGDRLN